ncbi:32006_t:CDS:1, partial [Gigaspora margarita]
IGKMFAYLLAGSKESKKSKALPKSKTSKSKDKRKRRENSESTSSRPIALLLEVGSPISTAIAKLSYTSEVFR